MARNKLVGLDADDNQKIGDRTRMVRIDWNVAQFQLLAIFDAGRYFDFEFFDLTTFPGRAANRTGAPQSIARAATQLTFFVHRYLQIL